MNQTNQNQTDADNQNQNQNQIQIRSPEYLSRYGELMLQVKPDEFTNDARVRACLDGGFDEFLPEGFPVAYNSVREVGGGVVEVTLRFQPRPETSDALLSNDLETLVTKGILGMLRNWYGLNVTDGEPRATEYVFRVKP